MSRALCSHQYGTPSSQVRREASHTRANLSHAAAIAFLGASKVASQFIHPAYPQGIRIGTNSNNKVNNAAIVNLRKMPARFAARSELSACVCAELL